MDAYQRGEDRTWQFQAFNLLLTIDHLEDIVRHHSFESFCESKSAIKLVAETLSEISNMVRRIPMHVRTAHSNVPWPFLRSLDTLFDIDILSDNPAGAWRILNSRIIPGATSLAPLVERLHLVSDKTG